MKNITKKISIIGLGKMGGNLAQNLLRNDYTVIGKNRDHSKALKLAKKGLIPALSYEDMFSNYSDGEVKVVILFLPHSITKSIIKEVLPYLNDKDYLIDMANAHFLESQKNYKDLEGKVNFLDCGVSGGPEGALNGACMMIGGKKENFLNLEGMFKDTCVEKGYSFFPGEGAGHFVKMVHNGIEYGMMQAIGEGMNLLKSSDLNINLTDAISVYNHGSVIESRLIGWVQKGYKTYSEELPEFSGSVGYTGEGEWTADYAKSIGQPAPIIEKSVAYRKTSHITPSYIGKVLSLMREMFGGKRKIK